MTLMPRGVRTFTSSPTRARSNDNATGEAMLMVPVARLASSTPTIVTVTGASASFPSAAGMASAVRAVD